ncbi:MAG: hypothetical protein IT392_00180 [Nitrospirae bacterium]|nr:hypothetical protein [Nitrospirota bacterium]
MSIIKKTLEENYIFFIRELSRIDDEIKNLPGGSISAKKIGKSTYYYHQWREGKKVKSVSLGTEIPPGLLQAINRRKLLEGQIKEISKEITIIAKVIDTQRVTVDDIIKVLSQNDIRVILIGSYCFPILKEEMKLNLPTIKTQDIDFLLNIPYRGKNIDIVLLLKPLGFSLGFNPDGSNFFTNGIFKIEFLAPQGGRGTDEPVYIKPLKISATPLRYLRMLFDQQIEVEKDGYKFIVPNPWVLAYHKILIAKNRRVKDKKEKDIMQAAAILREISKRPDDLINALSYLETLPAKWKSYIKGRIAEYIPDITL